MDFILQEAEYDAPTLQFSDDENRDTAEFDKFDKFEKSAKNFTKTLLRFDEVENHLVFSVIYGIMHHKNRE